MTENHPLTDELAKSIAPNWEWAMDVGEEIVFTYDDMRAAADWQLEQVIKWLEETEYDQYIHDEIIYASDLRKAMRPQQQEDN